MAITNISSVSVGDVVKCVDLKGITFPSITEGNLYTVAAVSTSKNLIGVRSGVSEAVYYYAARRFDDVVYKMAVIDLEVHKEIKTNPQLTEFMNEHNLACVLTFKGGKADGLVVMRRSVTSALPEEASVKGHMPSFPDNSWGHIASYDSTYIAGRLPDAFGGYCIYSSEIEAIVTHFKGFMKLINIEPNKEEEDKKMKKESMISVKPGDIIVLKTLEEAKKEDVRLYLNPEMNKYFDGKTQYTVHKVYNDYDGTTFSLKEIGGWLFSPSWVLKKLTSKKEATIAKGGTYIELDLKDYPEVQSIEDLEVVLGDFEAAIIKHVHKRASGGNLLVFKSSYLRNFDTLADDDDDYAFDEIPELSPKWGHRGNGFLKFDSFSLDFRCWWIDVEAASTTKDAKELFSDLNLIPVNKTSTPAPDVKVDITALHGEEFEKALFADGEQAVIIDFGKAVTEIDETAVVLIANELLDKAEELGVEAHISREPVNAEWGVDSPYVLEKTGTLKGHCGKFETLGVCRGMPITPDAIETAREELDSLLSAVEEAEKLEAKEEAKKVIEDLPKPIIHRFYS